MSIFEEYGAFNKVWHFMWILYYKIRTFHVNSLPNRWLINLKKQMIIMKYQALFSLKNEKKKKKYIYIYIC